MGYKEGTKTIIAIEVTKIVMVSGTKARCIVRLCEGESRVSRLYEKESHARG